MSDTATNRDGSYLKAHVEAETDRTIPPSRFDEHWQMFLEHLGPALARGIEQHEKNVARSWYEWGAMDGRLSR